MEREKLLVEYSRGSASELSADEVYKNRLEECWRMDEEITDLLQKCRGNKGLREDLWRLEL